MSLSKLSDYGTSFQIKAISCMLTDKKLLQTIDDIVSDEYFENQGQKWIVQQILKYYEKYHCPPTMEVLKVELKKLKNEVLQISIKEQLREAYTASEDDLEYIGTEFSNFCKNQQLKKALLNSVDLLNAGEYDAIRSLVDNALKAGQDKDIGHEYDKDTESRYREEHRQIVSTPWKEINGITQGGLGNGDFGLVFGNPGGGKSWALVALGGYAVEQGFNVIHYTLELGAQYVGRRYDAYFTNINVSDITQHRDIIETKIQNLPGKLIIKEYPPMRASISTIESHIQKCIDLGFKPDLIIIDYVDLLSTRKKSIDRKGEIDDIYISTKGLARQLNLPIWSVSQVNRAGAKDDIIEGDKAAGSYDKIMITDLAMSLSRKRQDKVNGTGRLHIMKNRYGIDGMTYGVKVDISTGHFELSDYDEEESEEAPPMNNFGQINPMEKKQLKNKFFSLAKS
jgi:replicative DNA helicase